MNYQCFFFHSEQATLRKKQIQVSQSIQSSGSASTSNLRNSYNGNNNSKVDIFSNDRPPTNNNQSKSMTNLRRPATTSYSSTTMFDRTQGGNDLSKSSDLSKSFTITEEEVSENFFMPKKKILRPDGASLLDVYLSKKDDTWGKIIKAQYLEDEENKLHTRKKKEESNTEYAKRLKQQLDDIQQRKLLDMNENTLFAQLEDATVSFMLGK